MATFHTLIKVEDVKRVLQESANGIYGRLADREDVRLHAPSGIREHEGKLQINAGEWSWSKMEYHNEEWLTPSFVYIYEPCRGCNYPPSMCCLNAYDPDDESFDEAFAWLHYLPDVEIVVIEV